MTTPIAVAKSVAKEYEKRARAALSDVTAAHQELIAADAAVDQSRSRRAAAGPALSRAIDAALAVGITPDQLTELGMAVPAARTRRRIAASARNTACEGTLPPTDVDSAGADERGAPN